MCPSLSSEGGGGGMCHSLSSEVDDIMCPEF